MRFVKLELITKTRKDFQHLKTIINARKCVTRCRFCIWKTDIVYSTPESDKTFTSVSHHSKSLLTLSLSILTTPKILAFLLSMNCLYIGVTAKSLFILGFWKCWRKSDHAYFSDDKKPDKVFVKLAMELSRNWLW